MVALACHEMPEEEFEFPVMTSELTAETRQPVAIDSSATTQVSVTGTFATTERFIAYAFELRGAATINFTLTLAMHVRAGIGVYGPRRSTGQFGRTQNKAYGRGSVTLEWTAPTTDPGVYLLIIGRLPKRQAVDFTLTATCSGVGCGRVRPYCPVLTCSPMQCPAGFQEDAMGCPTCVCNDPTVTCAQHSDCRTNEKCEAGRCVVCDCAGKAIDPVCDTNGLEYINACELTCRGATLASAAKGCFARACAANADCASGMCDMPDGGATGSTDGGATGTCRVSATSIDACVNGCGTNGPPVCGVVRGRAQTLRNTCVLNCLGGDIVALGACRTGCATDVSCPGVSCAFGQRRNAFGCLTCDCRTAPACTVDTTCGPGAVCESGSCVACSACRTQPLSPMCGTDGIEYANDCDRRCRQGVVPIVMACTAATQCQVTCTTASDCQSLGVGLTMQCVGGFCAIAPCDSTASGCDNTSSVCGTDNVPYANSLAIPWCRGVRVRASGTCSGGSGSSDDCQAGNPVVCGDDGRTYLCAKKAAKDGVTVRSVGACPCAKVCGASGTFQCGSLGPSPGAYTCKSNECELASCDKNNRVTANDGRTYDSECALQKCDGVAVDTTKMVCSDVWKPVCGQNLKTYRNACEARAAGVRIRHPGVCEKLGTVCNYSPVFDPYCSDYGTVENPSVASCLGVPLRTRGTCAATKCGCPTTLSPVCGSDGRTYGNVCLMRCANPSNPASVTVRSSGPCAP